MFLQLPQRLDLPGQCLHSAKGSNDEPICSLRHAEGASAAEYMHHRQDLQPCNALPRLDAVGSWPE